MIDGVGRSPRRKHFGLQDDDVGHVSPFGSGYDAGVDAGVIRRSLARSAQDPLNELRRRIRSQDDNTWSKSET